MRLLIVGATGGTGQQLLAQALAAGHDVTAFAREPGKIAAQHPRLRCIRGDLADHRAMGDALRGHDAAISALGRGYSFKSEQLIQRAVPVILTAVEAAGLRRLIVVSALGVGESARQAPLPARLFFNTLLRGIYADKLIGDNLIRQSDLDWTIVQPSQMTDGPLTRQYRSGERLELRGRPAISRADVAHYILSIVADGAALRKTLIVSQ